MNAPSHDPEERWRRTVQQRGRPLKLKVGRLLREFGVSEFEYGVAESIEARLAQVGVTVWPSLVDADDDDVITLDMVPVEADAAPAPPPPSDGGAPVVELPFAGSRPPQPPPPPDGRFAPRTEPRFAPRAQPRGDSRPAPSPPAQPGVPQIEHSPLVRAAVEAERRVRSAYDQAAAAAEERISRLERELAVERDAISRTRDERDQLEQRMHAERRQAAARLQALAAAERTALRLLEAERAQLTNRAQAEFGADSERSATFLLAASLMFTVQVSPSAFHQLAPACCASPANQPGSAAVKFPMYFFGSALWIAAAARWRTRPRSSAA